MNDVVIRAENLGKRFTLRQRSAGAGLLRDRITELVKHPFQKRDVVARQEEFWALRNVDFTIARGDVVGIVGRNGAGKSTLLKILSRISEPTTGRVTIHGRVASLLEVGTGFHGELSGRENIFLNGAILGMTRMEIRRKFDEIVAFAEVERFLDTPVKHYSSGMYVRLAFAVAAHLEPEILVVDEVLAVGDSAFQKKCLGKMQEVASGHGRTVLYVSHNLASVRQLCNRAIFLERGTLVHQGPTPEVVAKYVASSRENAAATPTYRHIRGDGRAHVTKLRFTSAHEGEAMYAIFEQVRIQIDYRLKESMREIEFFLLIHADDGECLAASFQKDAGKLTTTTGLAGTVEISFMNTLAPGRYLVSAGIFDSTRQFLDWVEFAEAFQVDPGFANGQNFDQRLGRVSLQADWTTKDALAQ